MSTVAWAFPAPAAAREKLQTLSLAAPIATWEKGIPLGNGMTGGLLWGSGSTVNLSLVRGDLWDLRKPSTYKRPDFTYATLQRLVHARNQGQINEDFDNPQSKYPYPTKLSAGRLVLLFPKDDQVSRFTLDTRRAEGDVFLRAGQISAIVAATAPVAMLRITGPAPALLLDAPSGVSKLGYPPLERGESTTGSIHTIWLLQHAAMHLDYAVVVADRKMGDKSEIAIAIVSSHKGQDPVAVGKQRTEQALDRGYGALLVPHLAWWKKFWAISEVHVPQKELQKQYVLDKYFYGAASRANDPPMSLQGVWTADNGGLPPWRGDYHNDMNTEMTYLAAPEAGLFRQEDSYLDWNWNLLPVYGKFARSFYGVPGAIVPGNETLNGMPDGGWPPSAFSPVLSAWIAQSYYRQWRYTMDQTFLRTRAYPFAAHVGVSLLALMKTGPDGKLELPLSTSPELYGDSMKAWLPTQSNFDIALLRALYSHLAEMARAQGKVAAATHWQSVLAMLPHLDVENGVLTIAPGIPLPYSHRHLSNLIAIYPLDIVNIDSTAGRRLVDRSIANFIAKGPSAWVGWTYPWLACTLARAGEGDEALIYLDDYLRGFIFANGFHVNGDQSGTGLSSFHYHPFTLEGNFLAMQAVQEMLLQSWGGDLRIFPAVPSSWQSVSFKRLRGEGGFIVSADWRKGHAARVRIKATVAGLLRLRDPFTGARQEEWNLHVQREHGLLLVKLKSGETLTGREK